MLRTTLCQLARCSTTGRLFSRSLHQGNLVLSEEVSDAVHSNQPVVALESTIITHGMPYPHNLTTAKEVESVVRQNGAIPATVAILHGRIHVGVTSSQLEMLADPELDAVKTSRRDLPYVLSQGKHGGTTVSGTMIAAHEAGIPIFVTGGIGGVHRGAEDSMDVSADLRELGRTPVAVVSAGVKSILDIGRTLEYLETEGVFVASYGTSQDFPAFFTSRSGFKAPYNLENPDQAAQCIARSLKMGLGSGMLIGVPIPEEFAAAGDLIEKAVQTAVQEASARGIVGKEVTPYILGRVNQLTEGESLHSNIALIKNNAMVGSQIACALARLRSQSGPSQGQKSQSTTFKSSDVQQSSGERPVVIGGINIDFTASFDTDKIEANGATYPGQVTSSFGGVGQNIADCMTRLGMSPVFLSALGRDTYAELFKQQRKHMDLSHVAEHESHSTATYCAILEKSRDLIYGIGDFSIHSTIDKDYVLQYEEELAEAPLVVIDGNPHHSALKTVSDICQFHQVPVWFEPTDIHHVRKPFHSEAWQHFTFSSPNLNELRQFSSLYNGKHQIITDRSRPEGSLDETLSEAVDFALPLLDHIPVLVVTLGKYGALLCHTLEGDTLPRKGNMHQMNGKKVAVHYPALSPPEPIASVSGAGDCLASAVIAGAIRGRPIDECMKAAVLAAHLSLKCHQAVPTSISPQLLNSTNDLMQSWKPTPITP